MREGAHSPAVPRTQTPFRPLGSSPAAFAKLGDDCGMNSAPPSGAVKARRWPVVAPCSRAHICQVPREDRGHVIQTVSIRGCSRRA